MSVCADPDPTHLTKDDERFALKEKWMARSFFQREQNTHIELFSQHKLNWVNF